MAKKASLISLLGVTVIAIAFGIVIGTGIDREASAAGGKVSDPNGVAPDRYVYYPGTEELGPDEMRIIACGTGMLNKVFVSHLHTDHVGDLAALWAGGWTGGRTTPLEVWGPSGSREDMGTAYFIEHFLKAYNWDYMTRAVKVNPIPGSITAHEFDYQGENQNVYEDNGVTVRSWPAIHAGDGPVSYALYWNGYKVVFGGDTTPNTWFVKYAKDADIVIHEAMLTADQLRKFYNQPPSRTIMMNTDIHTSAQAFGKVMSMLQPKHAIAYHFFNEEGTRYGIYDGIRETYDGPLSMADDMMVWNLTPDGITERMAVSSDEAWDVEGTKEGLEPDPTRKGEIIWSELVNQRLDMTEVNKAWLDPYKKKHGLK